MSRLLNKLSSRAVVTATKPGRYSDGGNLFLVVDKAGSKRWVFLFRWRGQLREMGLGSLRSVTLAKAREKAAAARALIADGVNPIDARKSEQSIPTFGELADQFVAELSPQWRNPKHRAQWKSTLLTHAAPLRSIGVDEIGTDHVLGVLKPIWSKLPETASRVRGRIERVLDAARARGFRNGENPARWRGHLDHLLPKRQKLTRGHHAALPYSDMAPFIAKLRAREAVAARALEFAILTAARSNEALGAKWDEVDLKNAVWTVPAERMKAGRTHRVPLSHRATEILEEMQKIVRGPYVFPGQVRDRPLSVMSMQMVLRRMEVKGITVHGFRSAFRDWAGEETAYPRELAEAALAHTVGDQTERAYRRGDALERRRQLMAAWDRHCGGASQVSLLQATG